jgi:hypothetical protein
MREPSDRPFADPPNVWRVLDGIEPIVYVSHDADDGAWQFLPESGAIEEQAAVALLQDLCLQDPTLPQLARLPLGWRAERSGEDAPWMWLPCGMPLDVFSVADVEYADPDDDPDRLTEPAMGVIREAARAFVARDAKQMRRLARAEIDYQAIYYWVDQYPNIIAMPIGVFAQSVSAIRATAASQSIWSVRVDLADDDGRRSDLTLSGDLYCFGMEFVFVCTDCHVL